jgi:hypothetical protein
VQKELKQVMSLRPIAPGYGFPRKSWGWQSGIGPLGVTTALGLYWLSSSQVSNYTIAAEGQVRQSSTHVVDGKGHSLGKDSAGR